MCSDIKTQVPADHVLVCIEPQEGPDDEPSGERRRRPPPPPPLRQKLRFGLLVDVLKHDDLNPPGETTPNGETPPRGEDTILLLCVCVCSNMTI